MVVNELNVEALIFATFLLLKEIAFRTVTQQYIGMCGMIQAGAASLLL